MEHIATRLTSPRGIMGMFNSSKNQVNFTLGGISNKRTGLSVDCGPLGKKESRDQSMISISDLETKSPSKRIQKSITDSIASKLAVSNRRSTMIT